MLEVLLLHVVHDTADVVHPDVGIVGVVEATSHAEIFGGFG